MQSIKKFIPIAFENDVSNAPIAVKVMKTNVVLWRNMKQVVVQHDRCPHRGVKMSKGSVVDNTIECPYHGWRFNAQGDCTYIPQKKGKSKIPKACNVQTFDNIVHNGIVWAAVANANEEDFGTMPSELHMKDYTKSSKYLVTDYEFNAPFNYYLQIENLLDPAHLDFVHDGYQGSRSRAGPISLKFKKVNSREISGYFVFENPETPDLYIRFIKPSVVDVSIIDPISHKVVRKNIIFVAPSTDTTSRVLFRDVAFKDKLTSNIIVQNHFDIFFHMVPDSISKAHNQLFTNAFIENIMEQDIQALSAQQDNIGPGKEKYISAKFVMPCESDGLIREFRKWCASSDCKSI